MIQLKTYETLILQKEFLNRIGDLINIEGPILSLFQDLRNKDLYLFDWADSDKNFNRWLVYKVSPDSIKKFINNIISYKELFLSSLNLTYYFIDIDSNYSDCNYTLNKIESLPDAYIPMSENRFDKNDARNIDQIILTLSNFSKDYPFSLIKQNVLKNQPNIVKEPANELKKTHQKKYTFETIQKSNDARIVTRNPFSINLRERENAYENKRVPEYA